MLISVGYAIMAVGSRTRNRHYYSTIRNCGKRCHVVAKSLHDMFRKISDVIGIENEEGFCDLIIIVIFFANWSKFKSLIKDASN